MICCCPVIQAHNLPQWIFTGIKASSIRVKFIKNTSWNFFESLREYVLSIVYADAGIYGVN